MSEHLPRLVPLASAQIATVGVTTQETQAATQHSTINLTMNVYTDLKLLDVKGAVDALPLGDNSGHIASHGHRRRAGHPSAACTNACTNEAESVSKAGTI